MPTDSQKIGAVMIVGAGIAGIQSALDLANAGFKVYLVDDAPSIGGVMPQLDKTFPTNDCAMCILAPKLVDTGRHPNIHILCNSEVSAIEGDVGHFSVQLTTHSACVDPEKCNGCGDCAETCPVSLPSEFDEKIGRQKAISRPFPQAIPNIFGITKEEKPAPCRIGCPAETNVQGYVTLAARERWAEAFHLLKERIPFPGTLGRICNHPCELKCNRKDIEEPLAISEIKRFIADHYYAHPELESEYQRLKAEREQKNALEGACYREPFARDSSRGSGHKVAVIGAGPAGLTAASDLAKLGYTVEIFEAESEGGGMMRSVIPDFRLNKDYLRKEIQDLIQECGFKVHYGQALGRDFSMEDLRRQKFGAIFIAIGAQLGKGISLEGSEGYDMRSGLEFLRKVNLGQATPDDFKDKKALIIGGGNVAMDAARTARRFGGHVTIVYRRSQNEMPATLEEREEAREEGIEFMMLTNPKRFAPTGGGLECLRMELGAPDESGRRRPVPIQGSEFIIPCDVVLMAIGQEADTSPLAAEGLELAQGLLKADPATLQTSKADVFAGGDIVSGPASVVEAIEAGHEAAISIDRFLHSEDLRAGREKSREGAATPQRERYLRKGRIALRYRPAEERVNDFEETSLALPACDIIEEARRCLDCGGCAECMQCVASCGRGAVDHALRDIVKTFEVGSVILAPGYEKFRPREGGSLGYNLYPNVVTSIQFERMLSASGPHSGHIERPSDGKPPRKIAWLQCVGSRDETCERLYCSSICCMAATKEAIIAREHLPGLETHIYFMDIRSFGKNFEQYIDRAKDEYGVVFRRSRVPQVEQDSVTRNLRIRYFDETGSVAEEEYDMVVLSIGIQPCEKMGILAGMFRIQLNEYGFVQTHPYERTLTSRAGIYAAGVISEPKDIPESVTEASCAAADAAIALNEARGSEVMPKHYPPERDVSTEEPRIGVFICHCGTNIGGVVDVPKVVEAAQRLPHVVYADHNLYTCSQDAQEAMKKTIRELGINRVVVASCTPRTHEELFQDTIREAGLNPFLFQMANIRDQCSWVHRDIPGVATGKAVDLVRMAVAKAARLYPVRLSHLPLTQKALVIGGGIAGMSAALAIADQGFEAYLVEKESGLGGRLREMYLGLQDEDPRKLLEETIQRTLQHERIRVLLNSNVEEVSGYVGNFTSRIRTPDGAEEIEHGVIIVATGARAYQPSEYLYGVNRNILTQNELEKILSERGASDERLREVVMIQCVGSRSEEHPWCSRVCCSEAIRNALILKERCPATQVYIIYRDIRTYGFKEDFLYRRAREKGVIFIRYEEDAPPCVTEAGGNLEVRIFDDILRREIIFHPDKVVLSVGIIPAENEEVAKLLKVPLGADGFFAEAHAKLRPVDFASDGIFLCGTAHSPRFVDEVVTQGRAAASRAMTILSKETLETKGIIVRVNPRLCSGCELCVEVCAYSAREYDAEKGYVTVNEVLCQGCGVCSAACPSGASQQNGFSTKQILSMIDSLFAHEEELAHP
ncbi:MAG: FAD-dependent oxidoreductase [Candidatus Sumerlaeota bacterium]|nr:FAD-dependent oxidoreductase [Candidatus Sumerlaeota bacterium]